jgi:hypothetical protein
MTFKRNQQTFKYSDLSIEEQEAIVKESVQKANEEQRNVVKEFDRQFNAKQAN